MRALEAGTPMPEAVKQAVSTTARVAQSAVKAVGGPDVANLEFFGHTPRHPLADRYYSQRRCATATTSPRSPPSPRRGS